jgi:hypothetical protein
MKRVRALELKAADLDDMHASGWTRNLAAERMTQIAATVARAQPPAACEQPGSWSTCPWCR